MNKKALIYMKLVNSLAIIVLIASLILRFVTSDAGGSTFQSSGSADALYLVFMSLIFSFFIVLNFKVATSLNVSALEKVFSVASLFLFAFGIMFICYTSGLAI
jgi:hypothetical protein